MYTFVVQWCAVVFFALSFFETSQISVYLSLSYQSPPIIRYNVCIFAYGPTGSGKSTFMDLLMGLIMPNNGDIFIAVGTAYVGVKKIRKNFQTKRRLLVSEALVNAKKDFIEFVRTDMSAKDVIIQPETPFTTEFDEVDDTGFGNFVNFSSAERRVSNFREKLRLIESHSAASASLLTVTSSLSQIQFLEKKKASFCKPPLSVITN